jgi:hypothetical protein
MRARSIVKNKEYDGVRLSITGTNSGSASVFYSEANGNRYFYNVIGSTASVMESVTFEAYLSFTSSNAEAWVFNLVPMDYGQSVILECRVLGLKSDGTKGFLMNSFTGWRHSGSSLSTIGTPDYTYLSDFTSATSFYTTNATASVDLVIAGEASTVIDWDVHIKYTKGYHTLTSGGGGGGGWYPSPPQNIS